MIKFLSLLVFFTAHLELSVSVKDFETSFGKWKGTLTYLDYTSGKPYSLACNTTLEKDLSDAHKLIFSFE